MNQEEQAKLLAEWLDQNPGHPAPEGVAPEVLEAVYVLRPDLAPAPQVDLESILNRIEEGPFASPVPPQQMPSRSRMGIWRALGGLAAAAAVLIIALPQQGDLDEIGPQRTPPAPTSSPFKGLEPSFSAEDLTRATGLEQAEDSETFGEQQPLSEAGEGAPAPPNPASRSAPPPASLEAFTDTPQGEEERILDTLGFELSPSDPMLDIGSLGGADGFEGLAGTRGSYSAQTADELEEEAAPSVSDEARAGGASAPLQPSPRSTGSRPRAEERRKNLPFLSRSQQRAEPAEAAPAPTEDAGAPEEPSSDTDPLSVLRSQSYPQDYASSTPTLSSNPSSSEAQWLAAQEALDLLQQSKTDEAFSKAESGLQLSAANTSALSMLYWILGEVHLGRGARDSAQEAYLKAAELNAQR